MTRRPTAALSATLEQGSARHSGVGDETPHSATIRTDANRTPLFATVCRFPSGTWSGLECLPVETHRYQLQGERARGGFGKVLAAFDKRMDRSVAVKVPLSSTPDAEARFVREALVTARLQHPAIVPVYELARWPNGKPFYSMKMVEGRSLSELIEERKTLPERLALLPNLIAVADAIAYAHGQGIIHRDLKPSNILIGAFGETLVIDWGLAADLRQADHPDRELSTPYEIASATLTAAGKVMGTPQYMPPEQAQGGAVDERADVYALGAMLYHVLTGTPPYTGQTSAEILKKVTQAAPAPLSDVQSGVPGDLTAVVRKAMARNPEERYRTAKEFAEELKRFITGQLVKAYPYSKFQLVRRWLKRHRVAIVFALLLLTTHLLRG